MRQPWLWRLAVPVVLLAACGCAKRVPTSRGADQEVWKLIEELQSTPPGMRTGIAMDLEELRARAAPAVPYLLPLLQSEDESECLAASRAICAVGDPAVPFLPQVVKAWRRRLRLEDNTCGLAGPDTCEFGVSAIPYLVRELGRDPGKVFRSASGEGWFAGTDWEVPVRLLAYLQPEARPVLLRAMERVLQEGGERASQASDVLLNLKAEARPAVPALVKAVRRGRISDGRFVQAMVEIGGTDPQVLVELRRIAERSPDHNARSAAREALERLAR